MSDIYDMKDFSDLLYEDQKLIWDNIDARVDAGEKWLVEKMGIVDYFNRINIDNLAMHDPTACICGQIFVGELRKKILVDYFGEQPEDIDDESLESGYHLITDAGSYYTHLNFWPGEYAFLAQNRIDDYFLDDDFEYELLAISWVNKIEKRRAESGDMLNP